MTDPIDYIFNGSLVKGAFEAYNQPFAQIIHQTNPLYGMLFIIFQILTYMATRNLAMCFIVTLVGTILMFNLLGWLFISFNVVIMVIELGLLIQDWISK